MSLRIKVEAEPGNNLRDVMVEMADLASRVGVRLELRANDTVFWVDPDDTADGVRAAFDRLYPTSKYVASWIKHGAPRSPGKPS